MTLGTLSELIWQVYDSGRKKSTNQSFQEADVMAYSKLAFGNSMRQLYYLGKRVSEEDEYYFYSPVLSIKRFSLGEVNIQGMRRADMGMTDLYRLPKNAHMTNVYFVGCSSNESFSQVTQVSPGEENFYLGADFQSFMFYVVKGRGINTYHLPPCAKWVDIETTYDTGADTEVSLDVAYDVANEVLGRMMGIPDFLGKTVDNPYVVPLKNLKPKPQQEQTIQ